MILFFSSTPFSKSSIRASPELLRSLPVMTMCLIRLLAKQLGVDLDIYSAHKPEKSVRQRKVYDTGKLS